MTPVTNSTDEWAGGSFVPREAVVTSERHPGNPRMSAFGGKADIARIVRQAAWPARAEQFATSERRFGKAA